MREPLYRRIFDSETLLTQYPPRFQHSHKQALFEHAYPDGYGPVHQICVTRWSQEEPQSISLEAPLTTDVRPDFYDYKQTETGTEWHMNFADPRLFVAYGSRLFAQDEMQVAEHPLLASVREGLLATGHSTETTDGITSTPILLRNVERRLEVLTNEDCQAGRPKGLYGNRFAEAPLETVLNSTRRIDPPTITNLIAIAAPAYGHGAYTREEIKYIFATAYTGFSAATQESKDSGGTDKPTVVHSGFWGCGAFGGNRTLMIAMQVLAAKAANLSSLVFHAGDTLGLKDVLRGFDAAETIEFRSGPKCSLEELIVHISQMGYRWGVSDGN